MSGPRKRKRHRVRGLRLVKREGSPHYQIVGSIRGVPVRKSTGTDRPEAAEAIRLKLENELLMRDLTGNQGDALFSRAWNLYIAKNPEQKTRNVQLLLLHFREVKLADINDEKVIEFVSLHYPKAKPQSVNRLVYTPLIAILRLATKNKLCGGHSLTRLATRKKMVQHAPPEWMKDFLAGCTNDRLRILVRTLTTTACRVAEGCRIRWENIDLERLEITLERTKNGDPRVLAISKTLALELAALALTRPDDLPSYRVFGLKDRSSVNHALQRQCDRLKLPYYSTHKLGRHAFAARFLEKGHTLGELAAAAGWATGSLKMLYETYGHLEKQRMANAVREAAEGLEAT